MLDGLDGDKVRDECGVFGIWAPDRDVARLTYYGLYALQHRGQESAGIAVAGAEEMEVTKDMGLVSEVFNDRLLDTLRGGLALGHVRYSTTGSSSLANAQPLKFTYQGGTVALAHNGNLTNARSLREELEACGSVFQTTSDSEVIVNLLARYRDRSLEEALYHCLGQLEGAFSLVVLAQDRLIGVRDPQGLRPLCLGTLEGNSGWLVASESCALDTVGANFLRDVKPGEIVTLDGRGPRSLFAPGIPERPSHCVFEYIYLARPDSRLDGISVHRARWDLGHQLAEEWQPSADIVIAVPDSAIPAAMGYAQTAGLPFREGLIKNRYIGRTFIQPQQRVRDLNVHLKLNPLRDVIAGRRVIMIDDSIVRGTTSRKIVQMLKEAGAREVHVGVTSPPILNSCFYGIDTATRQELIAAQNQLSEIRRLIGADSIHYLSLPGLVQVMGQGRGFCLACFDGQYPTDVSQVLADKCEWEVECS